MATATKKNIVCNRVHDVRVDKGLSLTRLATEAGVTKSYLRGIENNTSNPTLDVLNKVSSVLGTKLVDLIEEPKREEPDIESTVFSYALRDLVYDRAKKGNPLTRETIEWLATAKFRRMTPATKEDYMLLLRVIGEC